MQDHEAQILNLVAGLVTLVLAPLAAGARRRVAC